jgi:hypothetical protein
MYRFELNSSHGLCASTCTLQRSSLPGRQTELNNMRSHGVGCGVRIGVAGIHVGTRRCSQPLRIGLWGERLRGVDAIDRLVVNRRPAHDVAGTDGKLGVERGGHIRPLLGVQVEEELVGVALHWRRRGQRGDLGEDVGGK